MTEDEENESASGVYSKFWRITLVIIAMLLVFVGPTYIPFALSKRIGYFTSIGAGFVLFVVGMFFIWFLIRKKIITQ